MFHSTRRPQPLTAGDTVIARLPHDSTGNPGTGLVANTWPYEDNSDIDIWFPKLGPPVLGKTAFAIHPEDIMPTTAGSEPWSSLDYRAAIRRLVLTAIEQHDTCDCPLEPELVKRLIDGTHPAFPNVHSRALRSGWVTLQFDAAVAARCLLADLSQDRPHYDLAPDAMHVTPATPLVQHAGTTIETAIEFGWQAMDESGATNMIITTHLPGRAEPAIIARYIAAPF